MNSTERYPTPMWNSPLRVAILGIVSVILFQCFFVGGMGGNWTILFYSGTRFSPPPDLTREMYQFRDSNGFDGQFYYYIARDFTNARNTSAYVDFPAMRWLRMLVPGLASMLALGNPGGVLVTYIALTWGLCALGIWLTASLCHAWGYPPLAGLAFLAIPAVFISLDRMMTDLTLVVAFVALAWSALPGHRRWAYAILVLAPLGRETGIALNGGWMLYQSWRRDWKTALLGGLTVLPFVAWFAFVFTKFHGSGGGYLGAPFSGIAHGLLTLDISAAPTWGHRVAAILDYLGVWGIAASFVLTPILFIRGERSPLMFCGLVYMAGISVFVKADMWSEAYSYARTGGPVALCLALIGAERRQWWLLAPIAAALPRILLQFLYVGRQAVVGWLGV
ncbi:MAG: hypothetical protein LC114_02845 [Bryobacterales bacterium]|nr:hypothetical protein [Bryobacterales bacterium]